MKSPLPSVPSLIYQRHLERRFKSLSQDSDTEWEFIDGSYVKAHQHGVGLSRGGNTSKIHLAFDSNCLPIGFIITGEGIHDSEVANEFNAYHSKKAEL